MATVVSKNLYELLGNDHDEDSDKEPEPPVKVVEKTPARTDKRNAPREAPSAPHTEENGRGSRRGGFSGNEGAFRDRNAGSSSNRGKPTEDGARSDRYADRRGGRSSEGRGGRGGRGGGRSVRDDRHSKGLASDSDKQAAHGWGGNEGKAELADEEAGEVIAKTEEKEALTGDVDAVPVDGEGKKAEPTPVAEPEPEDNSISFADYQAQLAEKKAALGSGIPEARKPNEGSKENKKWATAKVITKDDEEEFIAGSGGKAKRERERKQKQVVEIDQRFVEAPERGGRGGRGGSRGRGDNFRGQGDGTTRRGRGEGRGEGRGDIPYRPRGDGPRGGRGRGDAPARGAPRDGPRDSPKRGGPSAINTEDTKAFPSLGS